jgi:hypothetical protein
MNKSESISKLALSLVKATAKIKAVKMDAENPYYKSKYATLGALIDVAKPVCAEFGLATPAFMVSGQGTVGIEQWVIHESGEYISDTILLPLPEESKVRVAQEMGATVSYLRRYALSALLGMYADEDGDGEPSRSGTATASKPVPPKQAPKDEPTESGRPFDPAKVMGKLVATQATVPPATEKQVKLVARTLSNCCENEQDADQLKEWLFGVPSTKEADPKMVNAVLKWLNIGEDWQVGKYVQSEINNVLEYLKG